MQKKKGRLEHFLRCPKVDILMFIKSTSVPASAPNPSIPYKIQPQCSVSLNPGHGN